MDAGAIAILTFLKPPGSLMAAAVQRCCRVRGSAAAAMLALSMWFLTPAWAHVKTGADVLVERRMDLVLNRKVGLVTNQTGRLSSGQFLVDVLRAHGVRVVALFSPEHGIRGTAEAGEEVSDSVDARSGIRIHSLYGAARKPTAAMLRGIDVLLYDIQDVGVRFYTYISTMGLAMEAAAEAGIPFVVLDRPNPLGSMPVSGPVMEDSLRSFVGMYPIPVVYGLTCGELARMINGERWMRGRRRAHLEVVRMEGWTRTEPWTETGLQWYPPSPNIPSPSAAAVYPVTCYMEATSLSEGRGTGNPFQQFGAPFMHPPRMVAVLDSIGLDGLRFSPVIFTPASSKFKDERCSGVLVDVTDLRRCDAVFAGMIILRAVARQHYQGFTFDRKALSRLVGSAAAVDVVEGRLPAAAFRDRWQGKLRAFVARARQYMLYPEK